MAPRFCLELGLWGARVCRQPKRKSLLAKPKLDCLSLTLAVHENVVVTGGQSTDALPFRRSDLVPNSLACDLALELGEGQQHVEGQLTVLSIARLMPRMFSLSALNERHDGPGHGGRCSCRAFAFSPLADLADNIRFADDADHSFIGIAHDHGLCQSNGRSSALGAAEAHAPRMPSP